MVQGWFNVQSADSYAGLLPNSVSESANLTVPPRPRLGTAATGTRNSANPPWPLLAHRADKNLVYRTRTAAAEDVADCLIWDQTHDGLSLLRSAASTVAASFKPKRLEAIRRRARSMWYARCAWESRQSRLAMRTISRLETVISPEGTVKLAGSGLGGAGLVR